MKFQVSKAEKRGWEHWYVKMECLYHNGFLLTLHWADKEEGRANRRAKALMKLIREQGESPTPTPHTLGLKLMYSHVNVSANWKEVGKAWTFPS